MKTVWGCLEGDLGLLPGTLRPLWESALYASGMLVNPPDLTAPVELSGGRAAGGPVWPGWSGMVGEQDPSG